MPGIAGWLFFLMGCAQPAPTPIHIAEPEGFASILYPEGNPTTREGLALGKRLFFDPILSADSTVSCATCHRPELAFTDGLTTSRGIYGRAGKRNSPSLTNVGYLHQTLFWDGRSDDLESQALHPIADSNEMGGNWPLAVAKLRRHAQYGPAFVSAFSLTGEREINPDHVGRALAQYQRSLISADSKYDRVARGEAEYTEKEALGAAIFFDLGDEKQSVWFGRVPTGECAHCHTPPHFTNQRFFNNGLDGVTSLDNFPDKGRGAISGSPYENGLFKTPGLRNVALTAPYMHDGRLPDLESVVEHYNSGGHYAENRAANVLPLGLRESEKSALVAFLHTLTDTTFVHNPDHRMTNTTE